MHLEDIYNSRTLDGIRLLAKQFYRENGEIDGAIPQEMFDGIMRELKEKTGDHISPFGHVAYFYPKSGMTSVVPISYFGVVLLDVVYGNNEYGEQIKRNTAPILEKLGDILKANA